MAMTDASSSADMPITAADGTPLKKKLAQALFRSRVRAVGLVLPLFAFRHGQLCHTDFGIDVAGRLQ